MEEEEQVKDEEYCNTSLSLAPCSSTATLQFRALFPHRHPLKEEEEGSMSRSKDSPREGEEEEETSNYVSSVNGGSRKKLKLTKEQVNLLENSFRDNNTLGTSQKQDLAERLNIRPRQVEVWFQNRRARTKLKKIEVDCECLKRWCERLSDENRRLKEELQELKSASPLQVQKLLKEATLAVCPSCDRTAAAAARSTSQLAAPPVNTMLLGGRRRSQ